MEQRIKKALEERKKDGLLRVLRTAEHSGPGMIRVDGREYVDLSSNDYLGLASHPDVLRAAREVSSTVFGAGASRLMTGTGKLHAALEEKVAAFKGKPAALVFNSGYQANVGVISALMTREDVIFSDRLNHASIVDGIKLSGAKLVRFRHNDIAHLQELLKAQRGGYKSAMVITETVFSMDGDIAPVKDMIRLKKEHGCILMVDEAHATGVFGETGAGTVEDLGISDEVDIILGTFSKALGSFGAYVAVSRDMRDYLVNTCRSFIYSTALPHSVIAANMAALDLVKGEKHRRHELLGNAAFLRKTLREKGFEVRGESQIIPVIIGDNHKTVRLSDALKEKGYWTTPVRPPTVPLGEARLRISLSFDHGRDVLERFVGDIVKAYAEVCAERENDVDYRHKTIDDRPLKQ